MPVSASRPASAISPTHDRQRHIVSREVHEPYGADEAKRNSQQYNAGVEPALVGDVEQHHNQDEDGGHRDGEALVGGFDVFVLPGPDDVVAGRQLDLARDDVLRSIDPSADVGRGQVHVNPRGLAGVFTLDPRWAFVDADVSQLRQRNLRAGRCRHERAPKCRQVVTQFPLVAEVDRISL